MPPAPFSQAVWIASPLVGGVNTTVPAPYFRQTFHLGTLVRSARLSITALGLYEAEINGQRVGDQVFAPGWTEYRKRVPYQTYDVAALLQPGENALGAILGDGWYCGNLAFRPRQFYGRKPALLAQLHITLADGTEHIIATTTDWKTITGPILENDFLHGESYDARLELGPWSEPGYDASTWQGVMLFNDPGIELNPGIAPPVRRLGEIAPVAVLSSPAGKEGTRYYDLGQNFSGRVRITVRAEEGTTVTLRFAEILDKDGKLYVENLRRARATDHYTCASAAPEPWEPRFTFHGFRYVSVDGLAPAHTIELTGIVLHSDTPPMGEFECSNPMLNQLQRNIVWGQKSNFLEVPTDCPQRDERLGWTGDAQVFIRTACFNMDVRLFFHKWLLDLRDAQKDSGAVPPVIPNIDFDAFPDGGPAWSDAAIICPWTIYLCYGDRQVLADSYESMRRYLTFLGEKWSKGYIRGHPDAVPWGGFGDWLALDGSTARDGRTPKDLIGTAFCAYDADLMARIATVLGHTDHAAEYRALHGKIVDAFRRRFVTPDGLMASDTQTSYVLALHFGLIPEEARAATARELVRLIENNGNHMNTGFVGTPYILDVLEASGHLDVAYRLLENETFPSWIFPIKNGATTIWERWDGWTPEKGFQTASMNSFNHYAYGAVGDWMYHTVAGLEVDPAEPGYRHIIFKPRPGGTITWAKARLQTPQGVAAISWRLEAAGGTLELALTVPEEARATVYPPGGYVGEQAALRSGEHRITFRPAA